MAQIADKCTFIRQSAWCWRFGMLIVGTFAFSVAAFSAEPRGWLTVRAGAPVEVREQPSPFAAVLTTLRSGTQIQWFDQSEGWFELHMKEGKGFVYEEFVKKTKTESVAAPYRNATIDSEVSADEPDQVAVARTPTSTFPQGQPDQIVGQIQQRLTELGYDPGPVDGFMGRRTTQAIKEYQRLARLPVDGQPSGRLLKHLNERGRYQAKGPTSKQKPLAEAVAEEVGRAIGGLINGIFGSGKK